VVERRIGAGREQGEGRGIDDVHDPDAIHA